MADDEMQARGEAAADYAADLAETAPALPAALSPEREAGALRRAAWLVEREFGAGVTVAVAEDAPDGLARTARPGRPAIRVHE